MRIPGLQPNFDDIKRIADDDPNGSTEVASPKVGGHEIPDKNSQNYLQENKQVISTPPVPR